MEDYQIQYTLLALNLQVTVLMFLSIGFADIPNDLLIQGNDAMIYEKYKDAIQTYESILELGHEHADLYYNLGNAYYRLHYIGQAIWAYSNALKNSPRDTDFHIHLHHSIGT